MALLTELAPLASPKMCLKVLVSSLLLSPHSFLAGRE
jgi:hypothetical protein